jgi:hypothetical protein
MNVMKRRLYIALLTVILLGLILPVSACSNSGYTTFNIHEGMQPVSFEYPETYKLVRLDMENDGSAQYTTIGLVSSGSGNYSEIYVYIWNTTADLPGAKQIMDQLLENASQTVTGYKLESRTGATIGGISGEYAIFSTPGDTSNSQPAVVYRVGCCTSGTKAFEIDMTCDPYLKDTTQADYDHLLESFKMLN